MRRGHVVEPGVVAESLCPIAASNLVDQPPNLIGKGGCRQRTRLATNPIVENSLNPAVPIPWLHPDPQKPACRRYLPLKQPRPPLKR